MAKLSARVEQDPSVMKIHLSLAHAFQWVCSQEYNRPMELCCLRWRTISLPQVLTVFQPGFVQDGTYVAVLTYN